MCLNQTSLFRRNWRKGLFLLLLGFLGPQVNASQAPPDVPPATGATTRDHQTDLTEHWMVVPVGDHAAIVRVDSALTDAGIEVEGRPLGLAWDKTHFYFMRTGKIERLPRVGGAPEVLAEASFLGEFVLAGERLLWTTQSTMELDGWPVSPPRPGTVMKANKDGREARVLVADVDTRSLAFDQSSVYFSAGTAIERINFDGTGRQRLVDETGGTPLLRVDGDWLYFTRSNGVSRVSLKDRRVEVVADDLEIPLGLSARDGVVLILANAVINRHYPEYERPARLVRVEIAMAPQTLWSQADLLVSALDVHGDRARFLARTVEAPDVFRTIEVKIDTRCVEK
jgi:hypothetical protein